MFGESKQRLEARFILSTDDETEMTSAGGFLTWYDARENQPHRNAEFRLYFPTNAVTERATAGDLLIIATRPNREVLVVIVPAGHSVAPKLLWLFGLEAPSERFKTQVFEAGDPTLGFVARQLLDEIGIETEIPVTAENQLEVLLDKFGGDFPTTAAFSDFARKTAEASSAIEDPDSTLITWLEHEESLFRVLERHLVAKWLESETVDVDAFLKFSLSVHNRRKSRAGYAAENHLEAVFKSHSLSYSRTAKTEGKSKPDFVFPGKAAYHDTQFPTNRLLMLGVKTTCKDRWRQVLTEANRITEKHLFTIEPGISEDQTDEMRERRVQLVIPSPIHDTFASDQRKWLWTVADFIQVARSKATP